MTATAPSSASRRILYIDWMRGLACVIMFQGHCYNAWLSPQGYKSAVYGWSRLFATLAAPIFLFLAGVSIAITAGKLREKGAPRSAIARKIIFRGAEIFGLGLLFRVQEFVLGWPAAPWSDLFRVDVLNTIGLSMMLVGALCWLVAWPEEPVQEKTIVSSGNISAEAIDRERANFCYRGIAGGLLCAALISLITPLLWTTHRPSRLPWALESYINGVHIYHQPQPWLFPMFPWAAFTCAGLAMGFFLSLDFVKRRESQTMLAICAAGIAACAISVLADASPVHLYPVYDYWHTSPNFFLMRCGILLVILYLAYVWCSWRFAQPANLPKQKFSPLIQLGNTSLLVYWVHIEFVYGRFSLLPQNQSGPWKATGGLLIIFLGMLALSMLRTRWKDRSAKALQSNPAQAAATAES